MNRVHILSAHEGGQIIEPKQWQRWFQVFILAFMCLSIAITNTYYVGDVTIYHESKSAKRIAMHNAILRNQAPAGGWDTMGANSVNIRVLTIYLAETAHRVLGVDILKIYRSMDLTFIAMTLFLSFFFFRSLTTTSTAVIGILYLGSVLPLSYAFYYFHPWDRIGWLISLLAIWAVRKDKPYFLAFLIVLGVTIKMDILALAGLYFLVWLNRTNWIRVTVTTATISLLGLSMLALLTYCFPGGLDRQSGFDFFVWMKGGYWQFRYHPIDHPAFLAFTAVFCLAAIGLGSRSRFAIASFLYGLFLLFYFSLENYFIEIRAQMGFLLLLLPLALIGLDRLFQAERIHDAGSQTHVPDYSASDDAGNQ